MGFPRLRGPAADAGSTLKGGKRRGWTQPLSKDIAKGRGCGGWPVATVCSRLIEQVNEFAIENKGGGDIASLAEEDADAFADLQDAVFKI
jgi:hypothetical protein